MSNEDYIILKNIGIQDLPNQPAALVIEWLKSQPDFIGEAVAKLCYQKITSS